MRIKIFQNDVSVLEPVFRRWEDECKGIPMGIDLDLSTYLADLQKLVDDSNSDLFVLWDNDIPVGYMGLRTFNSPLGRQLVATDHYWYVIPEKRGVSALKFLPLAERWARAKGCSHLMMSASMLASDLHDRTCKLYEKFGMEKFETTYIKRVK